MFLKRKKSIFATHFKGDFFAADDLKNVPNGAKTY